MRTVVAPAAVVAKSTISLDELVEDRYIELYKPERRPTCVQVPYMSRMLRFFDRQGAANAEELRHPHARELARAHVARGFAGTFVHATWPQIARGVGFPVSGMGAKQIAHRYESRVKRTTRYLARAGFVDGPTSDGASPWDVVYEGRESVGILVRLPAGVAQLVRAAES